MQISVAWRLATLAELDSEKLRILATLAELDGEKLRTLATLAELDGEKLRILATLAELDGEKPRILAAMAELDGEKLRILATLGDARVTAPKYRFRVMESNAYRRGCQQEQLAAPPTLSFEEDVAGRRLSYTPGGGRLETQDHHRKVGSRKRAGPGFDFRACQVQRARHSTGGMWLVRDAVKTHPVATLTPAS